MAKGYLQDVEIVDFYNKPIITAYADSIGYVVPMKHIIEDHLGLDWKSMKRKMQTATEIPGGSERNPQEMVEVNLFNPIIVSGYDLSNGIGARLEHNYPEEDIPTFRPQQEYLCLPVEELNLFLAKISLNHVNPEVRENLYHYQKECGMALHDYWFRGMSINNRKDPSRISAARHDWCPRELTSKSLLKGATRYSAFAERNFESRVNPEDIEMHCKNVISNILDLELDAWDNQEGSLVFILAFMERAAFDILYFSIENNVPPEDLPDILDRNIQNAWENMGSLIIAVQAPFSPFPGLGRGAARELV